MHMQEFITINEVCKMLGTTSRTIRYYEQCGLLRTTRTVKSAPRRLDSESIERLRKILFLRKLGLSLDEIAEVIDSDEQAAELIRLKTAEIHAQIAELGERISLLKEVRACAERGENIYSVEESIGQPPDSQACMRVAAEVTRLLREERFAELAPYFDAETRAMPPEFFETVWHSHIKPCGAFVSVGRQTIQGRCVTTRLHYEKLGVAVKMEVYGGLASFLFLQYFKEENET